MESEPVDDGRREPAEGRTDVGSSGEDAGARPPGVRGWVDAVVTEVRAHPFAYVVLAAFTLAGPVVAHYLFPEAPAGVGILGGLAIGTYAALCAVPGKFL